MLKIKRLNKGILLLFLLVINMMPLLYGTIGQPVVLDKLHLYKILCVIKENTDKQLKAILADENHDSEQKQIFLSASHLVDEAVNLLNIITEKLNTKNPSLLYSGGTKYRFIKMCNALQHVDVKALEPRHLRQQHEAIKQFDQYITLYVGSRKFFLNAEDKVFLDTLTKFNQIMLLYLLKDDYFDIGFLDSIADYTIYQPWEFMCRHPKLTCGVAALTIAAIFYFYIYPQFVSLNNLNERYNISQDYGLSQGRADCGYYGLLHALMLRNAANQDEFNAMLARARANNNLLTPWKDFIVQQRRGGVNEILGSDWVEREEIDNILQDHNLVQQVLQPLIPGGQVNDDNVAILDLDLNNPYEQQTAYHGQQVDILKKEFKKKRITKTEYDNKLNEIRNQHNNRRNIDPADILEFLSEEDRQVLQNIQNGIAQHVVLHLPRHWIAIRTEHDDNSPHGIQVKIVDSMNRNRTNHTSVTSFLDTCTQNNQ